MSNSTNIPQSAQHPNPSVNTTADRSVSLPSWVIIVLVVLGFSLLHVWLHWYLHGVVSVHQLVLSSFLVLNLLVNFWELGLFFTGDSIREEYLNSKEYYSSKPTQAAMDVFNRRVPLARILSFKYWTGIWACYCHFDDGYSRKGSFGYNIDVGNGFSTVLPATLFVFGMSFEIIPARLLGIVGVAMFWQMFYGTVVYFFQFFNAGRHRGHSKKDLFLFVGTSNGMWFVFPLWGMLASIWMIYMDSYALFWQPGSSSIWSIF